MQFGFKSIDMLKIFIELYKLSGPNYKKRFWIIQVLIIFSALAELGGIGLIFPFMTAVSDPQMLYNFPLINDLAKYLSFENYNEKILLLGVLVLIMITIAAASSMITIYVLARFSADFGMYLSSNLFNYYIDNDYEFHTQRHSSELVKQLSVEAMRVSEGMVQPIMNLNARILLVLFILFAVILFNPLIALVGAVIFLSTYVILFLFVRSSLFENGKQISALMAHRYRMMTDAFVGIRDFKLLGRTEAIKLKFEKTGGDYARARSFNIAVGQVPRYLIELITFGSMILLVIFLVSRYGDAQTIIPVLSAYAFAGVKLLPAIQQVYLNISQIKSNQAAFNSLIDDLRDSKVSTSSKVKALVSDANIFPVGDIELKNVLYSHSNGRQNLSDVSLKIKMGSSVGIVGESGAGKSTLLNIISGLFIPHEGTVELGGVALTKENRNAWFAKFGYASQDPFLIDNDFFSNVALGLDENQIELERVTEVIHQSFLTETVEKAENGMRTRLGENGVNLSGGQRQRLAIARTLYLDSDILIFDEATSALDSKTERSIMSTIHSLEKVKTIIMVAHKIEILKDFDEIIVLKDGKIFERGSYSELLSNSGYFQKLTNKGTNFN